MDSPTSNPEAAEPAPDGNSSLSTAFLATVSHGPGVYQMLGKKQVLYVGKARDLRKRLSQYAHLKGSIHSKTAVMLSHVQRVETILTTTEKEALILEASLIKQHRPRYNVILRDDKNYPLIKVTTRDPWPRVMVTRKRLRDGNRYFGPYAVGHRHAGYPATALRPVSPAALQNHACTLAALPQLSDGPLPRPLRRQGHP